MIRNPFRKRKPIIGYDFGSKDSDYTSLVRGYKKKGKLYITEIELYDHEGRRVYGN
jgi:hypothetical protein